MKTAHTALNTQVDAQAAALARDRAQRSGALRFTPEPVPLSSC